MTDDKIGRDAMIAMKVSRAMQPFLRGLGNEIQGAVLADLLSLWLAGHIADTAENTRKLRDDILVQHIAAVCDLIPKSEKQILATVRPEGSA